LLRRGEHERLARSLRGAPSARMLREGIAFLHAFAAVRPLVLVVEDLHWSDLATLDLIAALARHPVRAPLLVVTTYRQVDAAARAHPIVPVARDLVRGGHAAEVLLQPLDRTAVLGYLDARFGDPRLAAALADRLLEQSTGSPLFLRSLADQLVARGAIEHAPDGWRLTRGSDSCLLELPQTLRDFIEGELAALPPGMREIVEAASVAGVEFAAPEAAAALARPAIDVEAACEELVRVGRLVRNAGDVTGAGDVRTRRYAFVHSTHRRIVYDRIGPLRRRELHRRLAEALEAAGATADDLAPRLALHFDCAGLSERAVGHLDRAAENAERRFAYREGSAYLRTALARLDALAGTGGARTERAGILHLRLGGLLVLAEGHSAPEIAEALERARAIFEAVASPRGLFVAEMGLGLNRMTRADYEGARAHTDRLLALGGTGPFAAVARCWAGFVASALGDLAQARAHLDAGVRAEPDPGVLRHYDAHRLIHSQLAVVLTVMGRAAEARAHAATALARSRTCGAPADLAHAFVLDAERAVLRRDRDRRPGIAAAASGIAIAKENGFLSYLALGRFYDAVLAGERSGRERVAVMQDALDERRRVGDRWHESMLLGLLAEAELAMADAPAARAHLDEAFTHLTRTHERHFEAELHRLRAECALLGGGRAARREATSHLRRATGVARAQQAGLWERRAAARLAALEAGDDRPAGT
jgi:tetratricopeptide (TPR) repeat protein